jgi:hypothetical protein
MSSQFKKNKWIVNTGCAHGEGLAQVLVVALNYFRRNATHKLQFGKNRYCLTLAMLGSPPHSWCGGT